MPEDLTELEQLERLEPLKMERLRLQGRDVFSDILTWADAYKRRYAQAKYMLLHRENYMALRRQIHLWHVNRIQDAGRLVYGIYIAPLPGIPQETEYAQARLTLQYLDTNIPALSEGDVIILYKEGSSDE